MRVMVIVKATKNSEAGVMPSEEAARRDGQVQRGAGEGGRHAGWGGLHPSSKGKRVRFSGGKKSVIDGPFAETKELVAGFWIWQVKSMEEAVEWVRRCPDPCPVRTRRSRFARSSKRRISAKSSRRSCAHKDRLR